MILLASAKHLHMIGDVFEHNHHVAIAERLDSELVPAAVQAYQYRCEPGGCAHSRAAKEFGSGINAMAKSGEVRWTAVCREQPAKCRISEHPLAIVAVEYRDRNINRLQCQVSVANGDR
ncbi:MAG: hypothetical protein ACXIUM_12085 [Wenzhouxiangella sp.]